MSANCDVVAIFLSYGQFGGIQKMACGKKTILIITFSSSTNVRGSNMTIQARKSRFGPWEVLQRPIMS